MLNLILSSHREQCYVDELDSDKGYYDSSDSVDQCVPDEQSHSAGGLEPDAPYGKGDQKRDYDGVENEG